MIRDYVPILAKLAMRRQADVDDAVYLVYAEDLETEKFPISDVATVCAALGKQPRAAYQTAFPAIGDILAGCQAIRRNREQAKREVEQHARLLAAKPLDDAEAKRWLDRIKAAARGETDQ